jgi:hypothetical protein
VGGCQSQSDRRRHRRPARPQMNREGGTTRERICLQLLQSSKQSQRPVDHAATGACACTASAAAVAPPAW